MKMSKAYQAFEIEAPQAYQQWINMVFGLDHAIGMDKKTKEFCYITALAVARIEDGLPFHVKMAKSSGATRDEVIGSILVALPAVGNMVVKSLPLAIEAYDGDN